MSAVFDGQVALVTGAGRGIGRACAEGLAEAGARVIAIARSGDDLAEVCTHPSGRIDSWTADVTSDEFIRQIATIDGLSILINNAGGNRPQPFVEVDIESLDFIIELNVRAAFRVAQAAAKTMLSQGLNRQHVIANGSRRFTESKRLLHDQARDRRADQGDGGRASAKGHSGEHGGADLC